jgi:hypothetical protein
VRAIVKVINEQLGLRATLSNRKLTGEDLNGKAAFVVPDGEMVSEFKNPGLEFSLGPERWTTFLDRSLDSARGASFYISNFVKSGVALSPHTVKNPTLSLVFSKLGQTGTSRDVSRRLETAGERTTILPSHYWSRCLNSTQI